jgi:regulator of replication initiation timing
MAVVQSHLLEEEMNSPTPAVKAVQAKIPALIADRNRLAIENERLRVALRHLRNHTSVSSHQIELIDEALLERSKPQGEVK